MMLSSFPSADLNHASSRRCNTTTEQNASSEQITDRPQAGSFPINDLRVETEIPTTSPSNRTSTSNDHNSVATSSMWSPPLEAIFLFYIHIVLFSLHQLYYKSLDEIFTQQGLLSIDSSPSWRRSISAVQLSIKVCAPAAVFEILFGVFVVQNSGQPVPCIFGYVVIALNVIALLNMIIISMFVRLAGPARHTNFQLTGDIDRSIPLQAAAICAIPLSSLTWSTFFAIICFVSYTVQRGAPEVQISPPQENHHIAPRSDPCFSRAWSQIVLIMSYVIIGIFAALVVLHFVFVVRTVIRLVDPAAWGATKIPEDLEMDASSSLQPDSDTVSIDWGSIGSSQASTSYS